MILNGWKEIATHLGRGVRTVQRWESLGMPVRRPKRKDRSAVCAFSEEIDDWLRSAPAHEKSEQTPHSKPGAEPFPARIVLVDDDEAVLVTTAAVLLREGYDVRTARDGFEALAILRGSTPDVLISDLRMPNMSGFELFAIVRKRFPALAVIAISGEFAPLTSPQIIADRYLQKSAKLAGELKKTIRDLLSESPMRVQPAKAPPPTWVPRSTNGYVVMVCSDCLRPFSVPVGHVELDNPGTEKCPHCGQDVQYFINSTVEATDVLPPSVLEESNTRIRSVQAVVQELKGVNPKPAKKG